MRKHMGGGGGANIGENKIFKAVGSKWQKSLFSSINLRQVDLPLK